MNALTRSSRFHATFALAWLVSYASPAFGDVIHPGGSISSPTTWSAADGDHIVTGTIQISQSGSLTIEEGCTVRFEAGVRLEVSGTLNAVGGASGILFTQRDPGDAWRGIVFHHTTGVYFLRLDTGDRTEQHRLVRVQ